MSTQTISVNMDVSGVKTAASDFMAALQGQSQAVTDLFTKMATLNEKGEVVRQVVTGIAADGSKLTATLQASAKGFDVINVKVEAATKSLENFKKAQANAAKVGDIAVDTIGGRQFDTSQANAMQTAVQKIKTLVAEGSIEAKRLGELIDQLSSNPRQLFPNLTAEEAKFVKAYRSMLAELEKFDAAEKRSADTAEKAEQKKAQAAADAALKMAQTAQRKIDSSSAESAIRNNFAAPSEISRLNTYEQAIQKIKKAIDDGKVSLERFNQLSAQVKANPQLSLAGLTQDEQKVVKALRDIQGSTDAVANSAKKAESVFISLGGAFRLLQAQVLKRIFGTLEAEIVGSVAAAQQLSIAIAEIQTITQKANISTEEWQRNISALANQFGNSQADVAEGIYQAISNQVVKAGESFTFLAEAQKFAAATQSTTAQSVNLLSSAIKSFGLAAGDTERIAGVFFKTIELGRVRAGEMSDSFGRIGTIAQEAGVKLEEVAAGIATLTVRGTKFNDASTIMSNLLLKLIRPTDEMKKLFAEWGVATGDQAIATFGFVGVLQKLEVEAQKGTGRLGDLFNQIRALRGAFNFTGAGLKDFQTNLDQITQGGTEYQNAIKKVLESPGKQLQIELQKIRSMFVDEFGTQLLKGIIQFRDGLRQLGVESFADGISKLITAVKVLGTAWVGYRTSLLAATAAQAAFTPVLTASGVAAQGLATSTALVGATLLGAVGAGIALGVALNWMFPAAKGAKELADQFDRISKIDVKQKFDALAQPQRARDNALVDNVEGANEIRLRAVLQFSAAVNAKFTELRTRAIQNHKDVTEALKLSSKSYFDSINGNIKTLNEKITESKTIIEQSKKLAEDLPRRGANRVFDFKMQFASEGQIDNGQLVGEQKTILLQAKLTETLNRAREEAAKGTKESIEESRKLYNDAEQLQTQLFTKQTENERRLFEDRVRRGQETPTRTDSEGRQVYEFVARTAEFNRQVNALTQERLAIEEKIRAEKQKQIALDEAAVAAQKDKLRDLQEQFSKLEKLSVFGKNGEVKQDFKGPGGTQKALAEFDTIAAKIRELAGGDTAKDQFTVFAELAKQRVALIQEINVVQRAEDTKTAVNSVQQSLQASATIAKDAKESLEARRAAGISLATDIERQLAVITQRDLPNRGSVGTNRTDPRTGAVTNSGNPEAEKARQDALKFAEAVKIADAAFSQDQSVNNAAKLKLAIDALSNSTREYIQLQTKRDADQVKIGDDRQTIGQRSRDLEKAGREAMELATERSKLTNKLDNADRDAKAFKETINGIPGLFDEIDAAIGQTGPKLQENFQQVNESVGDVVNQVIALRQQIAQLNAELPALREAQGEFMGPVAPGNVFGGEVKYLSGGGMVGFVPRGSDQHPAMLAGGERVMTERANREWAPILQAMNNGALSKYGQGSGNSVTNVGDININYNGGGDSNAQNVRELGVMMRRGLRRGTINLNK